MQLAGRPTSLNIERMDSTVLGAVSASGLQCSEIAPVSVVLSSTPPSSSNSRTLMSNNKRLTVLRRLRDLPTVAKARDHDAY